MTKKAAIVGIIMGSASDWPTMSKASDMLRQFEVPHERRVISAHRTPDLMRSYALEAAIRGIEVIIAGAGGAAHLPGMVASFTTIPVIGVPVQSRALSGLDSLLSIVQMPGGVPVATMAIGEAGAINAGMFVVSLLAIRRPELREALERFRIERQNEVLAQTLD